MRRTRTAATSVALVAVVVLGALTRESTALILSFYATVYFLNFGFSRRKDLLELLLLSAAFLATYLWLRVAYGFDDAVHQGIMLFDSISLGGLISVLFFLSTFTFLVLDSKTAKMALIFLLFCSPYIIMVLLFGALFEIRLWLPLILNLAILVRLNYRSVEFGFSKPLAAKDR